jgi:NADH-quinone oxidoreductase subunit F
VLGDAMAMPIGSLIAKFRGEFEEHIEEARMRNGLAMTGPVDDSDSTLAVQGVL